VWGMATAACALEVLGWTTGRMWERLLGGPVPDPLLLRTHPSTHERTRRLRRLEPDDGARWYLVGRPAPPSGYPRVVDRPRRPGLRGSQP
jgi:hypothetical protein